QDQDGRLGTGDDSSGDAASRRTPGEPRPAGGSGAGTAPGPAPERARAPARLPPGGSTVAPPGRRASPAPNRGRAPRGSSPPRRRTKSQIAAKETSAITIATAPLSPTARRPK